MAIAMLSTFIVFSIFFVLLFLDYCIYHLTFFDMIMYVQQSILICVYEYLKVAFLRFYIIIMFP